MGPNVGYDEETGIDALQTHWYCKCVNKTQQVLPLQNKTTNQREELKNIAPSSAYMIALCDVKGVVRKYASPSSASLSAWSHFINT